MTHARPAPAQKLSVFVAGQFVCKSGANAGDMLTFSAELVLDDVYELAFRAEPQELSILPSAASHFQISHNSVLGTPLGSIHLDSALMFMSPGGQTLDALLLVEVDAQGNMLETFVMPLAPLAARTPYSLVGIDTNTARQKFAQVAFMSFTRGTQITLATGAQRQIEDLRVGDPVLTRDDGVQEIRWIGLTTTRATGGLAPIRIQAGTLNNDRDLLVSPDHRLFIYQRSDELGAGRAELLIKARYLVNGDTITVQEGGFVDYFQLLFDGHQIIYAEGIAVETLLIDSRTKPVLPHDMAHALGDVIPGHSNLPLAGLDVDEMLLDRPDAAEALRKASGK